MEQQLSVVSNQKSVRENRQCKRYAVCGNMVGEGRRAEYCLHCSNTRSQWNDKCKAYMKKYHARKGKKYES